MKDKSWKTTEMEDKICPQMRSGDLPGSEAQQMKSGDHLAAPPQQDDAQLSNKIQQSKTDGIRPANQR